MRRKITHIVCYTLIFSIVYSSYTTIQTEQTEAVDSHMTLVYLCGVEI